MLKIAKTTKRNSEQIFVESLWVYQQFEVRIGH